MTSESPDIKNYDETDFKNFMVFTTDRTDNEN